MEQTIENKTALTAACSAFKGFELVAAGELNAVVIAVKTGSYDSTEAGVLVFDNLTGKVIDVDLRGINDEVPTGVNRQSQLASATSTLVESLRQDHVGPGRPKLGVVAREVTLLPRHWDWLNNQPGGASVALRKLVEEARKINAGKDRTRESQDRTYRFLSTIAGDLAGYEESLRALYAGDKIKFDLTMVAWPPDIRSHALILAADAFTMD